MIDLDRSLPQMSTSSAVSPTVRSFDSILLLAYFASREDVSVVLRFTGVLDWHYGYPNDEGLDAHPLYGSGLEHYAFHVTPVAEHGERAWIATFHEGTFTAFARSVEVLATAFAGEPAEAIRAIAGDGPTQALDEASEGSA